MSKDLQLPGNVTKQLSGQDALGPREVSITASVEMVDSMQDIVVSSGMSPAVCNVPVLFSHDVSTVPIGRAYLRAQAGKVIGRVEFLPAGVSARADEVCAAVKAGALDAVSIGFTPITSAPRKGQRGTTYSTWICNELSFVVVGACDAARVTAKSAEQAIERDRRIARVREISETTARQASAIDALPTALLTKAERAAIVAAVLARDEAPRAELTGLAKHFDERGRHAYAVAAAVRRANPTKEDRLVMAERAAARGRGF